MNERLNNSKSTYDLVFETLMEKLYRVRFNSTLESAVNYSVELFNSAKKTIFIADTQFKSPLWGRPEIAQSLTLAAQRGIDIRLILGPEYCSENADIAKLVDSGMMQVHKLDHETSQRFLVVDENHVRIEQGTSEADINKAFIIKDSKMIGRRLAMDFMELWFRSKPLAVGELVGV